MTAPVNTCLELAPGLSAVGGSVLASLAGTWLPPGTKGWLPVQCYALNSGEELLLIDTGLTIHRGEITQGLRPLLAKTTRRSVLTTRREPDTLVNLPWLVRQLGFGRVFLSGILNPLDYFESFEFRSTEAQLDATCDIDVTWLAPGQAVEVGDVRIEVFPPLIRVLATDWFYESGSGTLFTSDFGGFFVNNDPCGPFVWSGDERDLSVDRIASIIGTKCEWLRSIDTQPMIESIRQVRVGRDVQRICPSFGGIIEGRENVTRVLDCVAQALDLLSRQPWESFLKNFDWERALAVS